MGKERLSRTLMIPLVLVLAATLVATAACTPADAELLKGVLQNYSSANGTVTLVTQDGKTVTIKIANDTVVLTPSANETVGNLAPGASVEIKLKKDGKSASHIDSRQAEVEGNITKISSGNITVAGKNNREVTIQVTNNTRIRMNDDRTGTLADLQTGVSVQAVYDPSTNIALKIKIEDKDNDENEGKERSKVGWGIVEIRVTDPPPASVKSAVVHLSSIEVHMAGNDVSDNSSDNTSGWITVIGAPASFDLMSINGIDQILGSANLTAGKYTQIRMSVTNVTGVTTDNVSYTAEVPGDKVKIVGSFNVGDGKKTVLTLDFDGEKSLVRTGEGKFLFKPVVKLIVNNGGEGSEDNRGESDKGQSGEKGRSENEDKGNSSNNSGNNEGKKD